MLGIRDRHRPGGELEEPGALHELELGCKSIAYHRTKPSDSVVRMIRALRFIPGDLPRAEGEHLIQKAGEVTRAGFKEAVRTAGEGVTTPFRIPANL